LKALVFADACLYVLPTLCHEFAFIGILPWKTATNSNTILQKIDVFLSFLWTWMDGKSSFKMKNCWGKYSHEKMVQVEKINGCIVWNAHNTVFGSKGSMSALPRTSQKIWKRLLYGLYCPGNDCELIPTLELETIHPVEGYFGSEFSAICIHCGVMAAWSSETLNIF